MRINTLNYLSYYYFEQDSAYSMDSALSTISRSYQLALKKENNLYKLYPFRRYAAMNRELGNFDKSLEILFNLLKISESNDKAKWKSSALKEIIDVMLTIKDFDRAEEYVEQLKGVLKETPDYKRKTRFYTSLGRYYKEVKVLDSALYYYQLGLDIHKESGDSLGIAHSYNNIGLAYKNEGEYDTALEYYIKSLKIKEELNDTKGMAGTNINIGQLYFLKKEYSKGLPFVQKGVQLTQKAKVKNFELAGYKTLYNIQRKLGNDTEALHALENLQDLEREISNQEQIDLAKELETKYNAEKLEQEAKIRDLELENSKITLSRQQNIIWILGVGIFIVVLLVILIFINFRQKKKINHELQEKNVLVEEQKQKTEEQNVLLSRKNKEITDSINYAKRIQEAILPSRFTIAESIANGFIMFQPKDVVSGDFYWMEEKNNDLFIAAADCTGHGVPGAMVSVICSNALSKALLEEGIEDPGKLLDRTRTIVINQLQKSSEHVNDGMDISLATIDRKNREIKWAGANNPLWIIRHEESDKIEEYRPDKQPVGAYHQAKPFTPHQIDVDDKDRIYLFSDGFIDQFGGPNNKKFKPAQFRKLLIEIQELPIEEHKGALKKAFEKWKGDQEQVDDVCVIGIEL